MQINFVLGWFSHELEHWCHPDGNDGQLYIDDDDFCESIDSYVSKIISDRDTLIREWSMTFDELKDDFMDTFDQDIDNDMLVTLFIESLEDYIYFNF